MKRPSFQWYPADWRNNAKLRRCTWAARGVWVDVLGLLHDSDEYGVVRWPWMEIASAAGCRPGLMRELIDKAVLKGCELGECQPYVFTPRHGRADGDPVTLIAVQSGPIWFSSRMVRDEYIRTKRGNADTIGATPMHAPNPPIGATPMPDIVPRTRARTPPQSSSSSSSKGLDQKQSQEPGPFSKTVNGKIAHGTRLPDGWSLPDSWRDWALLFRTDWDEERVVRESLSFRDWWYAKAGKDARKADWLATWRTWIRRST